MRGGQLKCPTGKSKNPENYFTQEHPLLSMRSSGKFFSLLFIVILAATSLTILQTTTAQTTPKPSTPEFTLTLITHPYDVASVTTTDPYTGKTKIIQEGYHVENKTIEVTIKNQPFIPYNDANGNYVMLSYNVSLKGHYTDDWEYYPIAIKTPLKATTGEYTVVTFGIYNPDIQYIFNINIPESGEIDFQVKSLIGYYIIKEVRYPVPGGPFYNITFVGQASDWSNIQTISIPDGLVTTSTPNPTETPTSTLPPDSSPTLYNSSSNTLLTDNAQLTIIAVTVSVLVAVIISLLLYVKHLKSKMLS